LAWTVSPGWLPVYLAAHHHHQKCRDRRPPPTPPRAQTASSPMTVPIASDGDLGFSIARFTSRQDVAQLRRSAPPFHAMTATRPPVEAWRYQARPGSGRASRAEPRPSARRLGGVRRSLDDDRRVDRGDDPIIRDRQIVRDENMPRAGKDGLEHPSRSASPT